MLLDPTPHIMRNHTGSDNRIKSNNAVPAVSIGNIMSIDKRLEAETKEIEQLKATKARLELVLKATETRLQEEVKEAREAIDSVGLKIDVRESHKEFMEEAVQERDAFAQQLKDAFEMMELDLNSSELAVMPESVRELGDMLGIKEEAPPEVDSKAA